MEIIFDTETDYHLNEIDILSRSLLEHCYARKGASAIIEAAPHISLPAEQLEAYKETLKVIDMKIKDLADQIYKHKKELEKLEM
jgi:hypothetical protein